MEQVAERLDAVNRWTGKVVRWLPNGPVHWGVRQFTSLQLWHFRRKRD